MPLDDGFRAIFRAIFQRVAAMAKTVSTGEKPNVSDRRYLRPEEANRLIEAAGRRGRNPFRDKVMLRAIFRHGLRVSEATGLRWSQIDLESRTIHIARLKGSLPSTHTLGRDELRDLRKLRRAVTGLYAFESKRGGRLSSDAVQHIVREAGRLAELDMEAHPHQLRHAAGYSLANQGVDTRLIQGFLGHKDIRHTVTYTELSPQRLAAVRVR
jgi:type 1 fimbriae regulatory protein FimB